MGRVEVTETTQRDEARAGAGAHGIVDVLVAAVVPGLPTMRRYKVQGAVLIAVGLVGPIVWLVATVLAHDNWIDLGLDRDALDQLIAVIAIMVIARLAGVGEVLAANATGPGNRTRAAVAFGALLAVTVPSAFAVAAAATARGDIGKAFGSGDTGPIFDAGAVHTTPTVPVASTTTPSTVPTSTAPGHSIPHEVITIDDDGGPDSGVDPADLEDVTTILLLGGDAGPGRSGLRTDSMILVSIHKPSGRAALVSFPRNAEHLLFPPGSYLHELFPNGYDDIANAIYPRTEYYADWREHYQVEGMEPGAVAITQAIGYSLDVTIDDYVVIDMQGFLDVVDALGGVTVDVPKAVPAPGNPPGAKHPVPDVIPAGVQHMDGTLALSYVRSRKGDSDYYRMARQRSVLAALASQISITDALTSYTAITGAVGDSLVTTMTADEFAYLFGLLGAGTAIVESVGLAPPLMDPTDPDYDQMAKVVGKVQMALVTGEPSGY